MFELRVPLGFRHEPKDARPEPMTLEAPRVGIDDPVVPDTELRVAPRLARSGS